MAANKTSAWKLNHVLVEWREHSNTAPSQRGRPLRLSHLLAVASLFGLMFFVLTALCFKWF